MHGLYKNRQRYWWLDWPHETQELWSIQCFDGDWIGKPSLSYCCVFQQRSLCLSTPVGRHNNRRVLVCQSNPRQIIELITNLVFQVANQATSAAVYFHTSPTYIYYTVGIIMHVRMLNTVKQLEVPPPFCRLACMWLDKGLLWFPNSVIINEHTRISSYLFLHYWRDLPFLSAILSSGGLSHHDRNLPPRFNAPGMSSLGLGFGLGLLLLLGNILHGCLL